jgi:hypothetical protein
MARKSWLFFLLILALLSCEEDKEEREVCYDDLYYKDVEKACPSLEQVTMNHVGKSSKVYGYIYEFKSGPVRWQYGKYVTCCYVAVASKRLHRNEKKRKHDEERARGVRLLPSNVRLVGYIR